MKYVLAILLAITPVLAEAPATIHWMASQFMVKVKVTRYLLDGSGVEYRYSTFKSQKICNGWNTDGEMSYQSCYIRLDGIEDLNYSYRIREYDRENREVTDLLCHPMNLRWECRKVVK